MKLSEMLQDFVNGLDKDLTDNLEPGETMEDWNEYKRDVGMMVGSLEGFGEPLGKKIHDIYSRAPSMLDDIPDDHFTREAVANAPKMARRMMHLTPLITGRPPTPELRTYVREATRAYVSGFFQACVALCRAGAEQALSREGPEKLLDRRLKSLAADVRLSGNAVLHNRPCSEGRALRTLLNTRELLVSLDDPGL